MRVGCLALIALLAISGGAHAVGPRNGINDTGLTLFGDGGSNKLAVEPPAYPGQDAGSGRDAGAQSGTVVKIGAGAKGFDYTKIANDGSALHATAALGTAAGAWGCTFDNVTGLMWEVKVNAPAHLRHMGYTYSWYDTNPGVNGGAPGTPSGGACSIAGRCDTEKFVADVNAAGMCGRSDWRMPTIKELESLADLGIETPEPTLDPEYFPNSVAASHWSASTNAYEPSGAWVVDFSTGAAYGKEGKENPNRVRLVRAGQ